MNTNKANISRVISIIICVTGIIFPLFSLNNMYYFSPYIGHLFNILDIYSIYFHNLDCLINSLMYLSASISLIVRPPVLLSDNNCKPYSHHKSVFDILPLNNPLHLPYILLRSFFIAPI